MGKDSVQKLNLRLSFEVRLTEVIFCLDKALQPVFTYLVFGIYSFYVSVRNRTICDTLRYHFYGLKHVKNTHGGVLL